MQKEQKKFKRGIVWFTNDLRMHDNPPLSRALEECQEIVPVFILDESLAGADAYGNPRIGPFRSKFICDSLSDLAASLKKAGSELITARGKSTEILSRIRKDYKAEKIYASRQIWHDEINIEKNVGEALPLETHYSNFMIDPSRLPFSLDELPMIFSDFRKKVEKSNVFRKPLPSPEKIPSPRITVNNKIEELFPETSAPDQRTAFPFTGGESSALQRLEDYIRGRELILNYKYTRNGLIGSDYSSKFSPWLANGCLSPSLIHLEIKQFEAEKKSNISTYWLKFELLWREFFRYTSMKYGKGMFQYRGIRQKDPGLSQDKNRFEKWKYGRTGDDFVDAAMKELMLTGYMSNRGRQNTASFLVHDLGVDWRWGAAWFESRLIDYDPASNYGNWQYITGIGNDPVENRKFNTSLQAEKYDPKKEFRQLWNQD